MGSALTRVRIDSPVIAASTPGEMSTAAAGSGSPASRSAKSRLTHSPPPAEVPAKAVQWGAKPWPSSQR